MQDIKKKAKDDIMKYNYDTIEETVMKSKNLSKVITMYTQDQHIVITFLGVQLDISMIKIRS